MTLPEAARRGAPVCVGGVNAIAIMVSQGRCVRSLNVVAHGYAGLLGSLLVPGGRGRTNNGKSPIMVMRWR